MTNHGGVSANRVKFFIKIELQKIINFFRGSLINMEDLAIKWRLLQVNAPIIFLVNVDKKQNVKFLVTQLPYKGKRKRLL